jgi:hypothetical protein
MNIEGNAEYLQKIVNELRDMNATKNIRIEELEEQVEKMTDEQNYEREILREIANRDEAEDALSEAFCIVTGEYPEWSSAFGFREALIQIEERMAALEPQEPAAPEPVPCPACGGMEQVPFKWDSKGIHMQPCPKCQPPSKNGK